MSLLGSLEIGKKSLNIAQTGQHTTGHNIANVDTEGFSRQEIHQVSSRPAVAGQGQGADINTVRRIQDGFTKEKVVNEQTNVGSWSTKESVLTEAESIFTDLEGNKLRGALDEFWSAWGTLSHEPESSPMRKSLLAKADALSSRFKIFDERLSGMRETLNARVSSKVLEVNSLSKQIAGLNKQVTQLENQGRPANDARDMREQLLQQISEIVEVRSFENKRGNLEVQISNGQALVHDRKSYDLVALMQSEEEGDVMIGLKSPTGYVADVTDEIHGGVLKEYTNQRDGNIKGFQDNLNNMAKELVFRVNAMHSGGTGIDGMKSYETSAYSLNDEARQNPLPYLREGSFSIQILDQYDRPETTINVKVEPGVDTVETLMQKINIQAGAYEEVQIGDEGATELHMREDAPFKAVFNDSGSLSLETGQGRRFHFDGDDTNFFAVMGFNSFFQGVNGAKDMKVNQDLMNNEMKIAAGYGMTPSDNRIAISINDLQSAGVMNDGTMTLDEFYNGQVTEIGLLTQDAQKGNRSHTQMLDQYEALRDSVSSVNLDEEMANMVKYQRAYESSAKFLSTVDQMTQTMINM